MHFKGEEEVLIWETLVSVICMYVCMYWAVLENIFLRESNRQEKKLRNAMILDSLHHQQKLPASWAHSQ